MCFVGCNPGVRVCKDCRKDENSRAWWELYNKLAIPQNQMPPLGRVEVSNSGDGAEAEEKVSTIHMWGTDNLGSKVIYT